MSLLEKYKEYKKKYAEYMEKKEGFSGRSEAFYFKMAEDLGVYELRSEVSMGLRELVDDIAALWKKLYEGEPELGDIDLCYKKLEEIIIYDDFVTFSSMDYYYALRGLVEAFKKRRLASLNEPVIEYKKDIKIEVSNK